MLSITEQYELIITTLINKYQSIKLWVDELHYIDFSSNVDKKILTFVYPIHQSLIYNELNHIRSFGHAVHFNYRPKKGMSSLYTDGLSFSNINDMEEITCFIHGFQSLFDLNINIYYQNENNRFYRIIKLQTRNNIPNLTAFHLVFDFKQIIEYAVALTLAKC